LARLKPLTLLLLLTFSFTNAVGQIAYIRNGAEIRLIEPDGANDRRLWTHPAATGINGLAWRPDHKELEFSSGHAAVTSLYQADISGSRALMAVR